MIEKHGAWRYKAVGCRCATCRGAIAADRRRYSERRRGLLKADPAAFRHGTLDTYALGCRCDECSLDARRRESRRAARTAFTGQKRQTWWTVADMQVATERRSDGSYVRSASDLAELLGRSRQAIKRIRRLCASDPKYIEAVGNGGQPGRS